MNFLTSSTARLTGATTRRRLLHAVASPFPQCSAASLHTSSSTTTTTTTTVLTHHHTTTTNNNNNNLHVLLTRLYSTRPLTNPKPPHVTTPHVEEKEEEEKKERVLDVKSALELQQRWTFIKKVYGIVTSQVVFTGAVASVVALNPPIVQALLSVPHLPLTLFGSSLACTPLHFSVFGFLFV